MAPTPPTPFHLLLIFLLSILISVSASPTTTTSDSSPPPIPTPWPHQFHSILDTTMSTGNRTIVDLWYDWPNSRNFNIIHYQLGQILYDLEWNNGTSFLYTLDASRKCRTLHFSVGILRPNWLDGANYLGQEMVDGFLCNVWEKVDFIWYYEDVVTKRPVYWRFYTGMSSHVMTFEVGAVLEDAKWQAPVYCFDKMGKGEKEDEEKKSEDFQGAIADGSQNSLRSLTRLMGHYDL